MEIKKNTWLISLLWFALIASSFTWNLKQTQREQERLALHTTRNIFEQIVLTRRWNAQHNGVYVPVTENTQPNPYLHSPMREIRVNDTLTLTKLNPAFMTRQISELARSRNGMQFHITSTNPLRPANRANEREYAALQSFIDKEKKEEGLFIEENGKLSFFYMAPLLAEKSCLHCHNNQDIQVGDTLGGISITLPFTAFPSNTVLLFAHLGLLVTGLVGIFLFGVHLERAYAIIKRQAVYDALTGIPNRLHFSEHITKEFSRSTRAKESLSVIMCDIDRFKDYNDTYGHGNGDTCLREIAQTIKKALARPGDFCARYGGEEFVIILTDTSHHGALHVAERIRKQILELQLVHEKSPPLKVVSLSLGVATSTDQPLVRSHEELLKNADSALYRAKANGRNRVESFSAMSFAQEP